MRSLQVPTENKLSQNIGRVIDAATQFHPLAYLHGGIQTQPEDNLGWRIGLCLPRSSPQVSAPPALLPHQRGPARMAPAPPALCCSGSSPEGAGCKEQITPAESIPVAF